MMAMGWLALWGLLACQPHESKGVLPEPSFPVAMDVPILPLTKADLPVGNERVRLAVSAASTGLKGDAFSLMSIYLQTTLSYPFTLLETDSYTDTMKAMETGRADVALLPPLTYVHLKQRLPGLKPVAHAIAQGTRAYSSFILVQQASPIQTLADLQGKRFTFVDSLSTSGFLYPWLDLYSHGIDPRFDLQVDYAGSHLEALQRLKDGDTDAIGTFSGLLAQARRQGAGMEGSEHRVRILHKSGRIPHDILCASADFPPSGVEKLRAALWRYNTQQPEGLSFYYASGHYTGWLPLTDDSEYQGVWHAWQQVEQKLAEVPG